MPHKNPNLDRTGHKPTFKQEVSMRLNWLKRIAKGYAAQSIVHRNHYWIIRHPEYDTALTEEQQAQLRAIKDCVEMAHRANQIVIDALENYNTLPKIEQPKRARQRVARKRQAPI